ncbi:TBC1 domain family member 25 [Eucyclogobius newberryi]|uniref:TBC1 domain family member 25 n=1 Tax=Eucyclogobius newberryi TaxID=166745 RepID=UPI003B5A344E
MSAGGAGGALKMAGEEEREVVRVKVKKCDGALPLELRSFAVDPQITSLEVLQHILIKAFDLNGKHSFGVSYLSREHGAAEVYLILTSDCDLDTAFVTAAKPYLQLKMDIKAPEDSPVMEDWDIISPKDVMTSEQLFADRTRSLASAALPFTQSLLSQVGRTLSRVQQAFSWSYGEEIKPFKPPLSDAEFHWYLNSQGQLTKPEELRLRIYHGGVEPSLRKVVWRYLLNVYPDGLSGQERMDYMKRKTREYHELKSEWTTRVSAEDLEFIRGNVLKDVLRTDRAHSYYAGSEDSPHLTALTNLLTTFAITHPQISYCQGMSDIASPILAVMDNEAHAFICFCGIMKRLEGNFRPDGQLMSVKFQHLKLLLQYSDPEFYSYLVSRGADDLFFCYRWLLLELKREFAFDDALRMLEITWSSLPPDPPETEVELFGPLLETDNSLNVMPRGVLIENKCGQDNQKERQRRQHMLRPSREEAAVPFVTEDKLLSESERTGEDNAKLSYFLSGRKSSFGEFNYYSARSEECFDMEGVELPQEQTQSKSSLCSHQSTVDSKEDPGEKTPLIKNAEISVASLSASMIPEVKNCVGKEDVAKTVVSTSNNSSAGIGASSPSRPRSLLSSPILSFGKGHFGCPPKSNANTNTLLSPGNKPLSTTAMKVDSLCLKPCSLPPPQEFGKGNPFMLFLCLSILLEHRDHIIKNGLDYNELAMHFDRLVRRHNLGRVLQRAKALFADYLHSEVWDSEEGDEVSSDSPTSVNGGPLCPTTTVPPQPIYSPLSSPRASSPNSTYNLTTTIPSTCSPNSTYKLTTTIPSPSSPNSTYNLTTTIPSPSSPNSTYNLTTTIPSPSSPNSTYNLTTTIPSPTAQVVLSPTF